MAALIRGVGCYKNVLTNGIMNCVRCGYPIPQARLAALPNARTCINCSQTQRVAGFPLITGKTEYSALQIVSQEDARRLQRMQARRGTGASAYITKEKRN